MNLSNFTGEQNVIITFIEFYFFGISDSDINV